MAEMVDSILNGSSLLITGGTGSFGNKFIEMVYRDYHPRRIIIFSRDELKQHIMRQRWPDSAESSIRYFIGDVRDHQRLKRAFEGVDVVIHAAALKQVPACEYNPSEAVRTNVLGALNVIEAALDCGVKQVLALSSDKATSPYNLYGATKLVAEKLFVQANSYRGEHGTRFACVRYGNVVGSRGSVVPLFREQAKAGRITITDPRMTRFWITLPQAAQFVVSCLTIMQGGEVFIPRLPSCRIADLAEAVAPGCGVEHIGIRPGEKLAESMLSEDESFSTVDLGDRYAILPTHPWWSNGNHAGAKPVPDGWCYRSDLNDRWLDVAELRRMIDAG